MMYHRKGNNPASKKCRNSLNYEFINTESGCWYKHDTSSSPTSENTISNKKKHINAYTVVLSLETKTNLCIIRKTNIPLIHLNVRTS